VLLESNSRAVGSTEGRDPAHNQKNRKDLDVPSPRSVNITSFDEIGNAAGYFDPKPSDRFFN